MSDPHDEARLAELRHIIERPDFRNELFASDVRRLIRMLDEARRAANAAAQGPWVWSTTDDNDLASMGENMMVSILAGTLRKLIEKYTIKTPTPADMDEFAERLGPSGVK